MKSLTKRVGVLTTVIAIAVLMLVGSCLAFGYTDIADADTDYAYKYFYNHIKIDTIAERFYKAFEKLAADGELKKGKLQYDLLANKVATLDEVKAYVNGADNNRLAKSYGMARDAFYMDHPDLFYVELFSTSITAGKQGDEYVAYLDSSRAVTMYKGASINSEASVNQAIEKYNAEIDKIVNGAKGLTSVKEKIEYVNKYICDNNKYGFGTEVKGDRNVDTPKAQFIHTSYGALVNKESVCEGYAKSFKAVMDRLGIPCVCVAGYASASKGSDNLQPHMWNYVQVEDMWYAVDVTYNSASSSNPWMLLGGQEMFETHVEDGSVSSSGYELRYPMLKPYNYGIDDDDNGMSVIGSYTDTNNQGKTLTVAVSYEGKGALKLEEEGKYLAFSFGVRDGNKETVWSPWTNVIAVNQAAKEITGIDLYPISDVETTIRGIGTDVEYIKFTVIKRAPDSIGDMYTGDFLVTYDPAKLTDDDFLCQPTTPYRNEGYGSYSPSPGAAGTYPSNSGDLPVDRTYNIRIVYNTTLELDAGYTKDQVKLDYYTSRGNDTIKDHAVITDFAWDGDKTITFTLTPSRMYIHNLAVYYFTPVGLVGAKSKKIPDPVSYTFGGKNVVCSKIFNDGRLYMNVFGAPNLLDNSDVSVKDFKDENGKYFAESQRSQLMLVASKPSADREQEMNDVLANKTGVKDDEIVTSATYEINLQICGVVQRVPNGSYMQVAFGFPEGYSPDDAGTTFKIYHYKHDSAGKITGVEEIPVIVTQYGLIAKVESFSPFMIAQIKNSSPAVSESTATNVYAYVNGEVGGKVTSAGKSGITQVSGDSITYNITPDRGYAIAYVRLNGKVVDAEKYKSGKLTLAKADIQSGNTLEVKFMAQEYANKYIDQGLSISFNGEVTNSFGVAVIEQADPKTNVAGIAIGCSVAVVVVAVAALVVWFVMKKKKEQNAVVAVSAKSQANKSSTATKATAAKQSKPSSTVVKSTTGNAKTSSSAKTATTAKATSTAKKTTATTAGKTAASKNTTSASKATASKTTTSASKNTASKTKTTAAQSTTAKSTKTAAKPSAKSTAAKDVKKK